MPIVPRQQINIKLDLTQGWLNSRSVSLKQCDNETRFLVVRLTNTLPLNIASYQPVMFVKRSDGKILKGLCQTLNAEEGEFVFKLKSEHLAVNGLLTFEIVLTKDGTKIMSFPHFNLNVVDSLHDEDVFTPTEDDLSILWEVIGRMQASIEEIEKKYKQFEQEKESEFQTSEANRSSIFTQSENARQSTFTQNENQRGSIFTQNEAQRAGTFTQSESDRHNAFTQSEANRQTTFTQAESVRQQAETSRQQAENTRQSQESARQQAEALRQETFEGMQDTVQEIYSTTLKYRIVE